MTLVSALRHLRCLWGITGADLGAGGGAGALAAGAADADAASLRPKMDEKKPGRAAGCWAASARRRPAGAAFSRSSFIAAEFIARFCSCFW